MNFSFFYRSQPFVPYNSPPTRQSGPAPACKSVAPEIAETKCFTYYEESPLERRNCHRLAAATTMYEQPRFQP
jgi:hypothetical protein